MMPATVDVAMNPLIIIDGIYEECGGQDTWTTKLYQYFDSFLSSEESFKQIPELSVTPLQKLRDGQLVKFRCQVQDMYDDEYYQSSYEVTTVTGATKSRTTRYRESASCKAGEKMMPRGEEMGSISQRTVAYCISLPGENEWVRQELSDRSPVSSCHVEAAQSSGVKRSAESDDEEEEMSTDQVSDNSSKRAKVSTATISTSQKTREVNLNLPLTDEKAVACLAKFYDSEPPNYILNQVYELVGVVSLDPELAATEEGTESLMEDSRGAAHHLPASVVPRLHVLRTRVLPHSNPLLSVESVPSLIGGSDFDPREARETLRKVLEVACLGDPLAGDYLISNIIGNVMSRQSFATVGQFALNLSGVTPALAEAGFPTRLASLLSRLVSHSAFIGLSLENLNTLQFIPKMDHSHHQLVSGALQLPRLTHLLLDETQLMEGKLDAMGIASVREMENIVVNQKCVYQYEFSTVEMETNLPVIIFSEKKSLLKAEFELCLRPSTDNVEEAFRKVDEILTSDTLVTLRKYVTAATFAEFEIANEMQEKMQQEFVDSRKDGNESMSPEHFSRLLCLSRQISKSCGNAQMKEDVWTSVKILERERLARLTRQ